MPYTPDFLDIPAFEQGLVAVRHAKEQARNIAIKEAGAYYRGFEDCVDSVLRMLHCSNFESKTSASRAFADGVNAGLYQLCKELGVDAENILTSDMDYIRKSGATADAVREKYVRKDPE